MPQAHPPGSTPRPTRSRFGHGHTDDIVDELDRWAVQVGQDMGPGRGWAAH
jgi:hypothetical protein